jgi:hypothetical protein
MSVLYYVTETHYLRFHDNEKLNETSLVKFWRCLLNIQQSKPIVIIIICLKVQFSWYVTTKVNCIQYENTFLKHLKFTRLFNKGK